MLPLIATFVGVLCVVNGLSVSVTTPPSLPSPAAATTPPSLPLPAAASANASAIAETGQTSGVSAMTTPMPSGAESTGGSGLLGAGMGVTAASAGASETPASGVNLTAANPPQGAVLPSQPPSDTSGSSGSGPTFVESNIVVLCMASAVAVATTRIAV